MNEKKIYVLNAADEILYCLNGVRYESVSYTDNLMEYDTLTFDVDKYIDVDGEHIQSNGYTHLKEMMYILVSDMDNDYSIGDAATTLAKRRGRFRISDVQINNDGFNESKTVSCDSCECEMNNQNLVGFKINTGDIDSAEYLADGNVDNATGFAKEYVTFYNNNNKQLSLLDLAIEKIPYWTIGYVDPLLRNKKFTFTVDSQPIYSFLMNELSSTAQCLFMFDTIDRKINVYSIARADELGDTNIFVGYRNLLNTVDISKSGDGVYTRFNVAGSDNLSIASVNYNDSYLENLTHLLYDVDEDGDYIYVDNDIQEKYTAWYEYRYGDTGHRQEFIDVVRQYNQSLIDISDIENRVPIDAVDYNQYDSFDEETLRQLLNTYITIVNSMVSDYAQKDSMGNVITDSNGLAVIIDMNGLRSSIYWEDYQLYVNILIPNLQTAIENINRPDDDKLPYIDTFETDWDLYGTVELNNKLSAYQQTISALKDAGYAKDWSEMTATEKSKWDEAVYNIYHTQYLKNQNQYNAAYIALNGTDSNGTVMYKDANGYYLQRKNGTQYYFNDDWDIIEISPKRSGTKLLGRTTELKNAKDNQAQLVKQRTNLVASAAIENEQFGFTQEQLKTIYRLRRDTDYVNDNILITSLDDVTSQLDTMEELFNAAMDELDIESQPQYELSATLDNLFNIEAFREYCGDFASGHFIRMILSDEEQIKLRITSITRNPCLDDDNALEIKFSNMIRDKNGLSDYTNLFQSAIQSSVNQITANYAKNLDSSQIYLSDDIIKSIANSYAMSKEVNNLIADSVTAKDGIFDVLLSQYIATDEFEARLTRSDTSIITEAWIKNLMVQGHIIAQSGTIYYLDAIHINANNIDAGTLTADRILLHGDDGLYYQINVDKLGESRIESMTELEKAELKNTIHADVITAHTITSDQLTVNNIQGTGGWINLANGTFEYRNAINGNGISWDGEHLLIQADSIVFSSGNNAEEMVQDATDKAVLAKNIADSKNTVYYQTTAPTGGVYKVNDVWFDTSSDNAIYCWNGTGWELHELGTAAIADGTITADKLTALDVIAQRLMAQDIEVTGTTHSADYVRTGTKTYADSGMGIEFNTRRFATPNFAIDPNGNIYARGGLIALFNLGRGNNATYNLGEPDEFINTEGESGSYQYDTLYLIAGEDGTAIYNIPKTATYAGETYTIGRLWVQVFAGSSESESEGVDPRLAGRVIYLKSDGTTVHESDFSALDYRPENSKLGNTFALNAEYLDESASVRLEVDLANGDRIRVQRQYGTWQALYYGSSNRLMGDPAGSYFGTDGLSIGEDIALTPDGHATVDALTAKGNVDVGGDVIFAAGKRRKIHWTTLTGTHTVEMRQTGSYGESDYWAILVDGSATNIALGIDASDITKSRFAGVAAKATADADGNTISSTYLKRSGDITPGGNVILNNSKGFYVKDSNGTNRRLATVTTDNLAVLGNTSIPLHLYGDTTYMHTKLDVSGTGNGIEISVPSGKHTINFRASGDSGSNIVSFLVDNSTSKVIYQVDTDTQKCNFPASVLSIGGFTVPQMQKGSLNVSNVTSTHKEFSVTFPKAFSAAPNVQLTALHNSNGALQVKLKSVSATGFTADIWNGTTTGITAGVYWLAIY